MHADDRFTLFRMTNFHPTAVIDASARIGKGVTIGPYCVVGPDVQLDDAVTLKAHVVVDGSTIVGAGTTIYPFASIGSAPQDLKYKGEPSLLVIGKNNIIREYVTMNPGTTGGGLRTVIGNNCMFMVGAHVAHDCVVGDHVVMANNATLGGHVRVGDRVVIGGLAAVHQFIRIGAYAVIGGTTGVVTDVIPFGRVKGDRAYLAGLNLVGLERGGFSKDQIKTMQKAVNRLFSSDRTLEERIQDMESNFGTDAHVGQIIQFVRERSRFGLCQPERAVA
jgi:UDP-N-acetylglucosamine acyltransferase